MKRNQIILIAVALLLVLGGAIFALTRSKNPTTGTPQDKNQPLTTKLLINELPLAERPFTVLVPHETNRLFTFVTMGADKAQTATLDLEYQSGDLLKGARASIESPIANPFIKAIILGSCSTGGKCTFDKDLKSGTMKFRLTFPGQNVTHMLKGDFSFILGQKNLPDGKVTFEPAKAIAKENLILLNSFGLPKPAEKETILYPVAISAVNDKNIVGSLSIKQSGVTSAAIYDGSSYQPIKYIEKDGELVFNLNNKPWSMQAEITRDDEKGSKQSLPLYILGPIVLYK